MPPPPPIEDPFYHRKSLRRERSMSGHPPVSSPTSSDETVVNEGTSSETTPLISRRTSTHTSHTLNEYVYNDSLSTFLFNRHYTPGLRSDKFYITCPAHVWHTVKLTIMSSTFLFFPSQYLSITFVHQPWSQVPYLYWCSYATL